MELSIEQQKALALSRARRRAGQSRTTDPLNVPSQALSGANEGAANFLSLPNNLLKGAELGLRSIGPAIGNALGGDFQMPTEPLLNLPDAGEAYRNATTAIGAIKPPTEDVAGQVARRVGQEVGSNIIPVAAGPAKVAGALATVGSGLGAATMQQIAPDNPGAELLGQVVGGGGVLGAANALERNALETAAPSVESLTDEAKVLYQAANSKGAVLPLQQSAQMASDMRQIAASEGIVTPKGRINESYEKIAALVRSFDDYGQGALTVDQMQSVRRLITNALKSPDGDERRIAMQMLDKFHKYLDPIAPEIAQANAIYHRAANGDMIETAIELARTRAGQFSGSGFQNALQTEFRALDRQIVKGQLKGLSQDEIDAIQKVARGGPIEDALRYLGKLAPTGVVSMSASGGVPFFIGNAVGGPAVGAAAAGATMGTGMAARAAATKMTEGNANVAAALARRGGRAVVPVVAPNTLRALEANLVGQAANQNSKSAVERELLNRTRSR